MQFVYPAIAVLEFSSITKGLLAVDVAVKKAAVQIRLAEAISHGKFILLFEGELAAVEEAHKAAAALSNDVLVEEILIPQVSDSIGPAIAGTVQSPGPFDAVGMFESSSIAAAIEALDRVLKTAPLKLNQLKVGKGIGGKSFFIFSGALEDVQAGLDSGEQALESRAALLGKELIARPQSEFLEVIF